MSFQTTNRSQFAIAQNRTRFFIEGDCIPGLINLDGRVLDVSKHYVAPESLPLPLLVEGDYLSQTGIVTKLAPHGDVLRFEAEIFNADTRTWTSDPLAAIHLGDLNFASIKAAPCSGGYGFTLEAVNLHTDCVLRGAQIDRLWTREPWINVKDPTFRSVRELWLSARVKAQRTKQATNRELQKAKEAGRREALAQINRRGK